MNKQKKPIKDYDTHQKPGLHCALPAVSERPLDSHINPGRESLIRYIEKKWVNNTVLNYYFFSSPTSWRGNESQKQAVRDAFNEWKQLGIGIEFIEVNNPDAAEIRIGFQKGSSWSYVGRDAIDLVTSVSERTVNFGWDLTNAFGKDTALHEIGHVLGFPHEHQNPNAGIVWDVNAVNTYFSGPPNNWDTNTTYYNILRKVSSAEVDGSSWDKNSIMHYQFNAGLIKTPAIYQTKPLIPQPGLSSVDKSEVKKFYPDNSNKTQTELKPYLSKILKLLAGQQIDYIIKPSISRKYTMQTFGTLDTVMVLFEDDNGNSVYLSGDDDSGTNYNSKIEYRLISGRTYYLRLRLYYSTSVGQGGVMLW
jgi:astacin (peptidase family M12A)